MKKTRVLRSKEFVIGDYLVRVSLEFCIKDLWFGLYWNNEYHNKAIPNMDMVSKEKYKIIDETIELNEMLSEIVLKVLDLYFIIIPTLALHFAFYERIEGI